jgi:hypothetical protein
VFSIALPLALATIPPALPAASIRSELEIGNDPAGIRYCVLLDDCTRHWRTDDALHVLENY